MMYHYYLSIGSNIEPRVERLVQAKAVLEHYGTITQESSLYETEPLVLDGNAPGNWHINQVIAIESKFNPEELLAIINTTEQIVGRTKREQWGDREIDIDILLNNNTIIDEDHLHIPHLELANRNFVLAPLSEIAPDVINPRSQKTITQLLSESTDNLKVTTYS